MKPPSSLAGAQVLKVMFEESARLSGLRPAPPVKSRQRLAGTRRDWLAA